MSKDEDIYRLLDVMDEKHEFGGLSCATAAATFSQSLSFCVQ